MIRNFLIIFLIICFTNVRASFIEFRGDTDQYFLWWEDNFDGAEINTDYWNYEIGGNGWGNNELQYYTDRSDNSSIEDGKLIIEAKEESYLNSNYTSARLTTQNKISFKHGKFEARIKLPKGQGVWPAFWMLGNNFLTDGWPNCGEIDIMELVGHQPNKVHGTVHFGSSPSDHQYRGNSYTLNSGDFSDDFHLFSVEWDSTQIRWFVDSNLFNQISENDVLPWNWPFNQEFFFILNIAVGGNWPGSPNATTVFPQKMEIDYIKVYGDTEIESTLSENIENDNNIVLYPNPASNYVYVKGQDFLNKDLTINLYDQFGKNQDVIFSKTNDKVYFNISALPKGSYFFKLESSDIKYSKFIFKN